MYCMSKSTYLSVTTPPTIVLCLVGVNVISLEVVAIPFAQTSIGPFTSVPWAPPTTLTVSCVSPPPAGKPSVNVPVTGV